MYEVVLDYIAPVPVSARRHIPGSVLHKALAAMWTRDYGPARHASAERRREYAALFEHGVRYGPLLAPGTSVIPLSVWRCARQPVPPCRETAVDEAYTDPSTHSCDVCGGPLCRSRGELDTHWTRDGDDPVQRLTGRIIGGTQWLTKERMFPLGSRGRAAYRADEIPQPPPPPHEDGDRLVIRLLSSAVLTDASGRPTTALDLLQASSLLGVDVLSAERSWIAPAAPLNDDATIGAGSVYELKLAETPTARGVAALCAYGVGLRRAEGFGWIETGRWAGLAAK